jgi:hypothetical protein
MAGCVLVGGRVYTCPMSSLDVDFTCPMSSLDVDIGNIG